MKSSLAIDNTTQSDLSFNPLGVKLIIRDGNGKPHERPLITMISMVPASTLIKAGEHKTFAIHLPTCEVLSDPCTEHVALEVRLGEHVLIRTSEIAYTLVADPTATYLASGLRGNRPLFLVQGQADGVVLGRSLQVSFRFANRSNAYPSTERERTTLASVFAQHGFTNGFAFGVDDSGIHYTVGLGDRLVDQSVQGAIDEAEHELGLSPNAVTISFLPPDADVDSILGRARSDAATRAEDLADFFNLPSIKRASGPNLGYTTLAKLNGGPWPPSRGVTYRWPMAMWPNLLDLFRNTQPGAIELRAVETEAFAGETAAMKPSLTESDVNESEYLPGGPNAELGLPVQATIAADRPELFALAQASSRKTGRRGFNASAVAATLALERTNALARDLGVAGGPISLVAAYTGPDSSEGAPVLVAGVSTAPQGDLDESWRRLVPTPVPQSAVRTPFAAIATVAPTPSPSPASREGAAYSVLPALPGDLKFTSAADVPATASPDFYRLAVSFDSRAAPKSAAPKMDDVERALRANPFVKNVSFSLPNGQWLEGFEVVISGADPNNVRRISDLIRREYRGYIEPQFHVGLGLNSCADIVLRAQHLSLERALRDAAAHSFPSNESLRRLILVAGVAPTIDDGDVCGAESPSFPYGESELRIRDELVVHAPIELVFRTQRS